MCEWYMLNKEYKVTSQQINTNHSYKKYVTETWHKISDYPVQEGENFLTESL